MAILSPIALELAQLQGHELYEVGVSGWGNRGTAISADVTGVGGVGWTNLSIVGAQVHPKSNIEGFRIQWSPQPQQPSQILPPDTIRSNEYFVMRDKPFVGRLQGGVGSGLSLVPLPQDYYADLYIAAGQQSTPAFGGAMAAGIFDPPEFWAILWLSNEPRDAGARTHYRRGPTTSVLSGFGTVDTIAALPMAGRKNIRVVLTSISVPNSPGSAARAVNVRLTGLAGENTGVGIGLHNELQQYEIQSVHVPAQTTVMVSVPNTPHQWLVLQAEVEEATPGALSWRVDASDYP